MDFEKYSLKHRHYWSGELSNRELKLLLDNNSFSSVIDIGCGDGALLYSLLKSGYLDHFSEVWAVDLSEDRLISVKKISEKIKTVFDDAQKLINIPNNHFELVISTQVIEHVKDDGEMIRSLSRVCKKEGMVYLDTVFKKSYGWYFYKNRYGKWVLDPTHEREYSDEKNLLNKIKKAGLEIISSKKVLQTFPIIDFFIRRLNIKSRKIYEKRGIKLIRKIKVPVLGYYCWKLILRKQ